MMLANLFEGKKVLVSGGAGFVGTNLLIKLLKTKAEITALIHNKSPQIKDKKIKFLKGNLTDKGFCSKAVGGIDFVFMCAANTSGAAVIENTPLVHFTDNVIMNTLMLEASYKAKVKKFLFISSNTVYPPFDHPVSEKEMMLGDPFEKYFPVAWMKRFGEISCEIYSTKINKPMLCLIVRPGNLYGPYDDFDPKTSHVIPALIKKVVERQNPIQVWGDGKDIKDLMYVEDFAEGLIRVMREIAKFQPINLASGKAISIKDVLKIILKIEGFENAKAKFDISKPTMIKKRLINVALANKSLGFEAKTSIEDGLKKTIEWYKKGVKEKYFLDF